MELLFAMHHYTQMGHYHCTPHTGKCQKWWCLVISFVIICPILLTLFWVMCASVSMLLGVIDITTINIYMLLLVIRSCGLLNPLIILASLVFIFSKAFMFFGRALILLVRAILLNAAGFLKMLFFFFRPPLVRLGKEILRGQTGVDWLVMLLCIIIFTVHMLFWVTWASLSVACDMITMTPVIWASIAAFPDAIGPIHHPDQAACLLVLLRAVVIVICHICDQFQPRCQHTPSVVPSKKRRPRRRGRRVNKHSSHRFYRRRKHYHKWHKPHGKPVPMQVFCICVCLLHILHIMHIGGLCANPH